MYLEQKYGEPFTVSLPLFWIMDGTFHADAAPVTNPEIIFVVGTEQVTNEMSDNYEMIRQEYALQVDLQAVFEQVFPKQQIEIYVTTDFGPNGDGIYVNSASITLAEDNVQEANAKLYIHLAQLQALNAYELLIFTPRSKLQLKHGTQPASEAELLALWQDRE